eukprot:TRINITY_DN18824_c0_g1_i1.p1 TRINITY_DN18824_c0_g1~~TRINITY_DN18824_c0_g1_i1.p1  ORF type:complete len:193 (+),score=20.75 TRINITY_DN18824_c0_g1_i1:59-580(+)
MSGPRSRQASRLWAAMQKTSLQPDVVSHSAALQASNWKINRAAEHLFRVGVYVPITCQLLNLANSPHRPGLKHLLMSSLAPKTKAINCKTTSSAASSTSSTFTQAAHIPLCRASASRISTSPACATAVNTAHPTAQLHLSEHISNPWSYGSAPDLGAFARDFSESSKWSAARK